MKIKYHGPGGNHIGMFGRPLMFREGEDGGGDGGGKEVKPDEKFVAMFNQLFHKSMTEREKRLEQRITKSMTDAIGKSFDELRTLIVDDKPNPNPDPGKQPDPGQGSQFKLPPEVEARIRKTEQDAKDAKERADKWEKAAQEEKQRNWNAEVRSQLQSALNGKVKPQLLDIAVNQLVSQHIVKDEETGNALWKEPDGTLLPIKDGATSWSKSDIGKEFAPPRNAAGTGGRVPTDGIPTKPGSMTAEGLGDIVHNSLMGKR